MLAEFERHDRRHGVRVVGRRDHDRVNALLLFEHQTEIAIGRRLRMRLAGLGQSIRIDIAKRRHIDVREAAQLVKVIAAASANADEGQVQLVIRPQLPRCGRKMRWQNGQPRRRARVKKTATIDDGRSGAAGTIHVHGVLSQ
jgi:hypothetical protein